jgi:hypothetical protein
MAARPYYRSRFLITGVTLVVLGLGNAVIGSQKLAQYERVVEEGRMHGWVPDAHTTDRILRPVDEDAERYNISRAKVDLYHVVLSGGVVMLAVGAILTIAAWVRLRVQRGAAIASALPSQSHPR